MTDTIKDNWDDLSDEESAPFINKSNTNTNTNIENEFNKKTSDPIPKVNVKVPIKKKTGPWPGIPQPQPHQQQQQANTPVVKRPIKKPPGLKIFQKKNVDDDDDDAQERENITGDDGLYDYESELMDKKFGTHFTVKH